MMLAAGGCAPSVTPEGPKAGGPAAKPASAQSTSQGNDADDAIRENLAKLSPEDRAAAEKQKTCPVSGARLGSMGVPLKVTVEGQTVFLCCGGCEHELRQNPQKYLAKLQGDETGDRPETHGAAHHP